MNLDKQPLYRRILMIFLHLIFASGVWLVSQLPGAVIYSMISNEMIALAIFAIVQIIIVYTLISIYVRLVFHSGLKEYRITKFSFHPIWFLVGIILPMLFTSIYLFVAPSNTYANPIASNDIPPILVLGLLGSIAAAVTEEIVFRGFAMKMVQDRLGTVAATIIPSVVFAAWHILMMKELTVAGVFMLLLGGTSVGIMFSHITLRCNSIWPSVYLHMLWNFRDSFISISTNPSTSSLFACRLQNNAYWISGGPFGVESSVIAILFYLFFAFMAHIIYPAKQG